MGPCLGIAEHNRQEPGIETQYVPRLPSWREANHIGISPNRAADKVILPPSHRRGNCRVRGYTLIGADEAACPISAGRTRPSTGLKVDRIRTDSPVQAVGGQDLRVSNIGPAEVDVDCAWRRRLPTSLEHPTAKRDHEGRRSRVAGCGICR